jgi:hypothetical protein
LHKYCTAHVKTGRQEQASYERGPGLLTNL